MHRLYIDPGTGSILFSIVAGVAAAAYFLFRALFIKIKFVFSGKSSAVPADYHSFVIYNEGKQYANVFKPILEEFESRGIKVLCLSSDRDDPIFDMPFAHIEKKYIGSGNQAFAFLNVLQADICLMTTPSLDVYQLKRSRGVKHYAHILHDTGDVICYRLFGIDWFDSLLLSGEYQKKDIRKLEKIRGTPVKDLEVIGSAYLDVLLSKKSSLPAEENHPFTVLVSPSWGPGSLLSCFGEKLLDPLADTGWRIIVRPHPQSKQSEKEILLRLENRYRDRPAIEWDYSSENLAALSKADIMISDYSGIIFDFIFLFKKPVLYANAHFDLEMYDASDLEHKPWKFTVVREFGVELTDGDIPLIKKKIEDAVMDSRLQEAMDNAKLTAWQHIGESGKRAVDFLIAKQRTLAN
jgi:hypothetical protein